MPRFLVIICSDRDAEAGVMPSTELLTAMGKYNAELHAAGVLLAGEGLCPSSRDGFRVKFGSGEKSTVANGPFKPETSLVAGYWVLKLEKVEQAVEWVKKAPFGDGAEVEIRRIFEMEDFGENFTDELKENERAMRADLESKN